jgi:diguanylate cyclase (GGDEF)-like protein/putative nucleotidyltransferase with HDIG domain
MARTAKLSIFVLISLGSGIAAHQFVNWQSSDPVKFALLLLLTIAASTMTVTLPGARGTVSVNFVFILAGVMSLSLRETLAIACCGTLIQTFWTPTQKPAWWELLMYLSNAVLATAASGLAYHAGMSFCGPDGSVVVLPAASAVFLIVNTAPLAAVMSVTARRPAYRIWCESYFWCLPCYLFGAVLTWSASEITWPLHLPASLKLALFAYFIHRTNKLYVGRMQDHQRHSNDLSALHLRTMETLATAMQAKDNSTRYHLRRARAYALQIGRELELPDRHLEALESAALLHDIGNLAVPQHIIAKPDKLTAEEFEKVKIHPIVGAEILEQVRFPVEVTAIVRSHHERWDGNGYPAGLCGEEIPIGARILAVIDSVNALISDRHHRPALDLKEAVEVVCEQAGTAFDPNVVAVLKKSYLKLERTLQTEPEDWSKLSGDLRVSCGAEPAAGFEQPASADKTVPDALRSIAAAHHEAQVMIEMAGELGNTLSLPETLSLADARLRMLVPYDAIAVYVKSGDVLIPEFAEGENCRFLRSLAIPVGQGMLGWVAQNQRPIINGNPMAEAGQIGEPRRYGTLRSALAVPLCADDRVIAVLALYSKTPDAFSREHLRILQTVQHRLGTAVENAVQYRLAESSAATDYVTGLPNARSVFLQLERELARSATSGHGVAVFVCDLDGFKQVNDQYGHNEGNKVLFHVASALKRNCRPYDYVGRLGGDEFVIILPEIRPEAIPLRVAQLRTVISEPGGPKAVDLIGLSVGSAFAPDDGTDSDALLAIADERMYAAKQAHKRTQRISKLSRSPMPVRAAAAGARAATCGQA